MPAGPERLHSVTYRIQENLTDTLLPTLRAACTSSSNSISNCVLFAINHTNKSQCFGITWIGWFRHQRDGHIIIVFVLSSAYPVLSSRQTGNLYFWLCRCTRTLQHDIAFQHDGDHSFGRFRATVIISFNTGVIIALVFIEND